MKHLQLYRNLIVIVVLVLISGGAIVYADFVKTSGGAGFGYGYGYGYSDGYGYGYGYHTDDAITDQETYGFFGTDGSAMIDSTTPTQTTIAVTYTTTYTGTNSVEYSTDLSYGSTSTPTEEVADTYTVTLTGLDCGTEYNIRLSSDDAGGNTWNDNATTETTSACSSGGGGGGGGGGFNPYYLLGGATGGNNNNTVGDGTGCVSGDSFSRTTGQKCPASITNAAKYVFTKDLELGMTHSEIKELQKYLNTHGFPVASTGAGSPGNETNYFGARTRKALAAFQKANGITPSVGYFGPKTRAFINSH